MCVCVFPYMQGMCTSLFSLYRLKSFVSLIITLIDLFNLIEHYLLLMHVTLVTSVFVFFMLFVWTNTAETVTQLLSSFFCSRHKGINSVFIINYLHICLAWCDSENHTPCLCYDVIMILKRTTASVSLNTSEDLFSTSPCPVWSQAKGLVSC